MITQLELDILLQNTTTTTLVDALLQIYTRIMQTMLDLSANQTNNLIALSEGQTAQIQATIQQTYQALTIPPYHETSLVEIVSELQRLNERLGQVERGQAFLAGALNQLGIAQATDTRQITSGLSHLTQLIEANQQAKNATPLATPLDRSTGSSRVLHVTVATPDNATPDATPLRRSTGSSKVLHKKIATPDGKRALIKEFFTQWPDASLNDCEQALGIERSTISRIRKALKESGGLQ